LALGSSGSAFGSSGSGAAFGSGSGYGAGSASGYGAGSGSGYGAGSGSSYGAGAGSSFGSGSAFAAGSGSSLALGSSGSTFASGSAPGLGSEGGSDSIIAKINQRLDLLAKEGTAGDGRQEQDSSFRFDSFSSLDSRRDPFRAAFASGDSAPERDRDRDRNLPFAARDPARTRGSVALLRAASGSAP
ncbi:AKAP8 protein, partial [Leucopsar rothschildi]|nr:AKAP8 protein [Leucopsar rothschildi]